jgi:hypothetical protein
MEAPRRPFARSQDLVVEELGDELLVYDLDGDNVHCLTPTAARVWRACDGKIDASDLADELDLGADDVSRALSELDASRLLVSTPFGNVAKANGGLSRRDFGLRVGKVTAAAAAAPLIISIVAPTAAQAQTVRCIDLPFEDECGTCNQGGTPTPCCCCHGGLHTDTGEPVPGASPSGCNASPKECCCGEFFNQDQGAHHCTEAGGTRVDCRGIECDGVPG